MKNAKTPGYMKDEMKGVKIKEFIALRPKMYFVLRVDAKEMEKRKGVLKSIKEIDHGSYIRTFESGEPQSVTFQTFTHTKDYQLQTMQQTKVALSRCNDKSYYVGPGWSLRYGHYLIPFLTNIDAMDLTTQNVNVVQEEWEWMEVLQEGSLMCNEVF